MAKTEALVKQLFSDLKAPDNERVRIRYEAPLTGHNQFIAVTDAEMPQTVMQVFIKHKEEKLITEANYIHSMQRQLFNQIMGERIATLAGENLSAFSDEVSSQTLIAGTLKPGKVIAVKKMESVGVTEWTLSNGARVVLKPTDFKNDEIRFEAFAPGGSSVYPDASYQNARNAAIIAGFGVGEINPIQLDKMMAGKILEVNPYITDRRQGIEGSAAPKDLETALQLMYLRFTSPRRDTALFDNTLNSAREMIANRASDPDNRFSDTVTLVLGNYNYRRTPPSLQKLNQLSLDKLYQIYRERFADAANFTFVFVGNFQVDSIRPAAGKIYRQPAGNS